MVFKVPNVHIEAKVYSIDRVEFRVIGRDYQLVSNIAKTIASLAKRRGYLIYGPKYLPVKKIKTRIRHMIKIYTIVIGIKGDSSTLREISKYISSIYK